MVQALAQVDRETRRMTWTRPQDEQWAEDCPHRLSPACRECHPEYWYQCDACDCYGVRGEMSTGFTGVTFPMEGTFCAYCTKDQDGMLDTDASECKQHRLYKGAH